jgi:uncharacterized repeat protein (TIGR01451 family)
MRSHIRYLLIAAIVSIFSILPLPGASARHNGNEPATIGSSRGEAGGDDPAADIGVSKSGTPDQVNPGSDITYEITVTNAGPDPAENANLSDMLPVTLTFVSLSAPAGWTCMTPGVGAGGAVNCTNPSLSFTSGDVFTLVVNVPADAATGTFFTNTATVSTTTFDPNDENNSGSTSTLVVGNSADIVVTKTASSDQVAAGSPLIYTIQVSNSGPDSAANVTLNDVLPSTVTFASLSQPAGWTCMTPAVGAGGTVNCTRPSLAVTSGEVFTIVVSVLSDTPVDTVVINTATVSTSTSEPTDENNSDTASATVVPGDPTAANGKISGRIVDDHGNPIAGATISLNGAESRKTISDANGNYQFDEVETNGFYTVTPSRVNYNFNPFDRSFSQVGNNTDAAFTASFKGDVANPLDTAEYFVRQQYVDVLGREPDEGGFNYWSDQILACGSSASCVNTRRRDVAAAFFIEQEFRQSGAFIYNLYKDALGRRPVYAEYSADRRQVVGGPTLEAQKQAFAAAFVVRAEFATRYQSTNTAESFVDALLANVRQASGVDLTSQRENLIGRYHTGTSQAESRTLVLREVTEGAAVRDANYNAAFVLVEYFGYLHRGPDQQGYDFWLSVLNTGDPGNYRGMVCSFITATEYQRRFSSIVSRSNSECSGP